MNSEQLTILGGKTKIPQSPDEAVLEKIPNPHSNVDYAIRFTCHEFTSLCPKTGQPDFAHLVIDYVPRNHIVESKALKLYLCSFRNHGAFHEDCTIGIAKKIIDTIEPAWLRIAGYWYPRGGMPIDIFYQSGNPPQRVYIPELEVPMYRGRG